MKPGDYVKLAPHLDWWMKGERYGTVVSIKTASQIATVELFRTSTMARIKITDLEVVD